MRQRRGIRKGFRLIQSANLIGQFRRQHESEIRNPVTAPRNCFPQWRDARCQSKDHCRPEKNPARSRIVQKMDECKHNSERDECGHRPSCEDGQPLAGGKQGGPARSPETACRQVDP
jgi:hypothetical protein